MAEFVGRSEPLARLLTAFRAATGAEPGTVLPGTALVLVSGEAGLGKTSLLHRFAAEVEAAGGTVAWGTCWDEQAPAWWPWTEALRRLQGQGVSLPSELDALMSSASALDATAEPGGRLLLIDAVAQLLERASADLPVVVVLDDLQWSDRSTVDLLRFLVRRPAGGRLLLVGAYRPGEARPEVAPALAELAVAAELVPLTGLTVAEVTDLVALLSGKLDAARWSQEVHARSEGHPFFARELCRMLATGADPRAVPPAVRDVVVRRIEALSPACGEILVAAAVAGSDFTVDLLAEVMGQEITTTGDLVGEALEAAILVESVPGLAFGHDLYRESLLATMSRSTRTDLHRRILLVLEERRSLGLPVHPGELARHSVGAVTPGDPARAEQAVRWARDAAAAEESRYAFAEAAGHLARARQAVTDAGLGLPPGEPARLTLAEANLRLKAGEGQQATGLLEAAWDQARALGDADLMGSVALGLDRSGARFAMPRDQLLGVLETARGQLAGMGSAAEAQVTAALARQLQHSVPTDRPRARPLAEDAVRIARDLGDDLTLASCLLAEHDALWTPGTAGRRVSIAHEIAGLARVAGDRERQAQALLLEASAELERGSPSFRATVGEYLAASRALRQPGHDYLVATREAALALLDGDLEKGDRLSAVAAELGTAVGETDTGNVRMSQRLEAVRAGGDADELRGFAVEAVDWWVGIPAHAHAVAAGFLAKAGDLDGAERELATVLSLGWRSDRSYMWSVYVGQVASAAIALQQLDLCRQLVDDLRPLRTACAVNGALVCFMGAHAHYLGLLHKALGDRRAGAGLLSEALRTHQRLGARAWEAETAGALADLGTGGVSLRRTGGVWEVGFRGQTAAVPHSKGLQDLATLVARPGVDVPALELAGVLASVPSASPSDDAVLDRTALAAYRTRLDDLDAELEDTRATADRGREARVSDEREQLLAELRRRTRPDGRAKGWDNRDSERARKAVSARIRDAIDRIEEVLPDLGQHLDRSVTTGTSCRYEPRPD